MFDQHMGPVVNLGLGRAHFKALSVKTLILHTRGIYSWFAVLQSFLKLPDSGTHHQVLLACF